MSEPLLNVTSSDVIAVLAFLGAVLAALYARWSARAAQRANQIALHNPRVDIYLELRKFENCFKGFLAYPTEDDLQRFYEKAVVMSELYFPREISGAFNAFYNDCWNLSRHIMAYENEEGDKALLRSFAVEYNQIGETSVASLAKILRSQVEIYRE